MASQSKYEILIETDAELGALQQSRNELLQLAKAEAEAGGISDQLAAKLAKVNVALRDRKAALKGLAEQETKALAPTPAAGGKSLADLVPPANQTTQSLSSAAGASQGLAAGIGAAVTAGVALNSAINKVAAGIDEQRIAAEKVSFELDQQLKAWRNIAATAQDSGDVNRLIGDVGKNLEGLLEKFRTISGEGTGGFFANALDGLKLTSNALIRAAIGADYFQTSTQKAQEKLSALIDLTAKKGRALEDFAERQVQALKQIETLPVGEQIAALVAKEIELTNTQASVNKTTADGAAKYIALQQQIDAVVKAEGRAIDQQNKLIDQMDKLGGEMDKLDFAQLSKPLQFTRLGSEIEGIRAQLRALGADAASPRAAFESVAGQVTAQAVEIQKLAVEWGKLSAEQKKAGDAMAEQAQKAAELGGKIGQAKEQQADLQKLLAAPTTQMEDRVKLADQLQKLTGEIKKLEKERSDAESKASPEEIKRLDAKLKLEKQLAQLKAIVPDKEDQPSPKTQQEISIDTATTNAKSTDPQTRANYTAVAEMLKKQVKEQLNQTNQPPPVPRPPVTDAKIDSFEKTLQQRGTADKLQSAGESLGSDVAPALDAGGAKLQSAGENLTGGAEAIVAAADDSLKPAAEALGSVPGHFTAIHDQLAPLPKAIGDAAGPIPAQIIQLGETTVAGFAAITTATTAAIANLQKQIDIASAQIARLG